MVYSNVLWNWHRDVVNGKIKTKNGRITLMDAKRNPMWYWNFEEAYPVKWSGSDFKADGSGVFIETLELVHKGIKKERSLVGQALHMLT
jgi:phage tail-like protein